MSPNIQIIEKLNSFLHKKSQRDCPDYRVSPKDFTRRRCLSMVAVVLFLISLKKKSLAISLDEFLPHFDNNRIPSKSAFTQARYKLKWTFFEDWSSELVKESDELYEKTWKNFRLYGIDGSTLYLPDSKAMRKEFGVQANKYGCKSMARIMCCYDVLNGFCHKATITPTPESELATAYDWVKNFDSNSLCIYDRGFASFALIYLHQLHSSEFVIRCKTTFNTQVKAFVKSNKKSATVDFKINTRAQETLQELGITLDNKATVKVRLLRIKLKTGEDEILITSLTNAKKYPHSLFKDLYFLRWKTEVFYDRLKNKAQVEVFVGQKPDAIKQEFYATIFVLNLQNMAIQEMSPQVDKDTEKRKYPYQTNYNVSLGLIVNEVADLFGSNEITCFWAKIRRFCVKYIEPVRVDRTFARKVKKKLKLKGRFYTSTNFRRAI